MMSFKGVALVTGAAQGIGRGIALRLANDGFDIVVNDLPSNSERLQRVVADIKAKGRKSAALFADVSREEQVKDLVGSVVKDFNRLDVMVANAGSLICEKFIDTKVEDFDRILATNVRGTFLCYKHSAIQMIKQGQGGRIIGASSLGGKRGWPLLSAYSASKFAIRGLTQTLAAELGPHGITVNAYAPGTIATDMLNDLAEASTKGGSPKDFFTQSEKMAVVGRLGEPKDVAHVVSFLASKEASFVTGQSISVDGGTYFD